MPRNWFKYLTGLVVLLAGGALLGALYGRPLLGLLAAALVALSWNAFWLFRLDRWLRGEPMAFLPDGSGVWAQIFAKIDFIRGRNKMRSRRFKKLAKQMRQATRSFPDGGILLGPDHEIITMNKVAEELLGLKGKKDRGMRIENLIRNPAFFDYMRGDDHDHPVEIPSPLNGGRWLACQLVSYGLNQELLLVRDISQQRKADQMRRDFVANASHELRTPLTVITGYLEVLEEDRSLSQDLAVPIAEMQRQADRMRTLVNELLRLSELESEGLAPAGVPVNISAILNTAKQEAHAMKECPGDIQVDVAEHADLYGDEADIQSVVSNLVSNAVRYTPPEGQIRISWEVDEAGGRITVRDTGAGIAAQHLPRLTERFYRVENGRERMGGAGGNGLGLAIVKHALVRHSARLDIQSEPGVGSSFTCIFPKERVATVA
jgi:two-component system phosphate regulon sensor histidine kinase PhoR